MKIVIATRNKHKMAEIAAIFDVNGVTLLTMESFPGVADVIEDAPTFSGNAAKKAYETARAIGLWTMADDSGLEVAALNGAPGVRSARYAGEHCSYADNNAKLLRVLEREKNRAACFRTVMALCSPWGSVRFAEGFCNGHITETPHGSDGFGYDPLFVPDGHSETFAQMNAAQKNAISHRARAIAAAWLAWKPFMAP